jgi:glycerol-3-phosphate acyltransferase PlsY
MPDPISWEFAGPYLALALAGGYLLGSVPFGLVVTRLAGLGDLRPWRWRADTCWGRCPSAWW